MRVGRKDSFGDGVHYLAERNWTNNSSRGFLYHSVKIHGVRSFSSKETQPQNQMVISILTCLPYPLSSFPVTASEINTGS